MSQNANRIYTNLAVAKPRNERFSKYLWSVLATCFYLKFFVISTVGNTYVTILRVLALVILLVAVYRVAFHDLTPFPGPMLWAASRLPMFFYLCRGTLPQKISELHAEYGNVVRIAPNELSFIDEEAWAPIYNKPLNRPQLAKDPTQFVRPSSGIGVCSMKKVIKFMDTSVNRRIFARAFADKTMLAQEQIIQNYITLFINRVEECGKNSLDVCNLLNCLTFDIIGDLAFGQSFGSLESSTLHPWISNIFDHVSLMVVFGMLQKFTVVYSLLTTLLHQQMRKAEKMHQSFVLDRLNRRLVRESDEPDFITHVQPFVNTPNGITLPQLSETLNQIVIGGAETTATILAATLYLLLINPSTLRRLTSELRTKFSSSGNITMKEIKTLSAAGELEYLHAVIDETSRLYAPTPGNLTRVTPSDGAVIGGCFVPGGTLVGVNLYSAGHSGSNFKDAEAFRPERWLSDAPDAYRNDRLKSVQPFSFGPRNCIGKNLANMEMRLILARLLFDFDISLDPVSSDWGKGMKIWGFYAKPKLMVNFTSVVRNNVDEEGKAR